MLIADDTADRVAPDVPMIADSPATELAMRLRQQELVAEFGLHTLREDRLAECLNRACEIAAMALSTQFAKVLRFRTATQDFLLVHGVGWREGVVGHAVVGADLASPAGYALRTRLPVVSNHLGEETRFRSPAVLAEHGIHRAINVIIEGEAGEPFGVLEVDSSDRQCFTLHDIACLQSLANVVSAAIERQARLRMQVALLAEKDVLMQEVHHRVKNSLQLVQTMLHLQARGIPVGEERDRLQDAARRIMTIAAVHRRLHQEGSVTGTDAEPYFEGLLEDISQSMVEASAARPITLAVEPMILLPDQITPLGLIVTELVTNALKYSSGPIGVKIVRTTEGSATFVTVSVDDAGTGFPADFDPAASRSLGMRLISALARSATAICVDRTVPFGRVSVRVALA